ncbi:serine/threonine-protein kinase/endoribonuclease IRE1b-like protein [Tanacetum coccineum]
MWVLELLPAASSIFIPLIVCCWNFGRRKQNKLNETVMVAKVQNVTPKKKKPRKSGKSRVDANTEKIMNGFQFTGSFERKIGKLLVSDKEIGKGSNGTIVLEGVYDARRVAVKHIVKVPTAVEVYHHPLFWNPEFRLSFRRDASDYVDFEDRVPDSSVLKALESIGTVVLGGKWDEKLDKILLKDVTQYRKYKYDSIRDLLRLIRNKSNHYRELSEEVQEVLGSLPTGFESYFSSRFPNLLMEVYKVLKPFCEEEEVFHKYYEQGWC